MGGQETKGGNPVSDKLMSGKLMSGLGNEQARNWALGWEFSQTGWVPSQPHLGAYQVHSGGNSVPKCLAGSAPCL